MNRPTLIQVETKVLLKISLASEFSFLDSKLARVHTHLRCIFQITLPLQCQTLPTKTHKGFWGVQSLKRKHWKMPMVHQVKRQSCLPLALYPWSWTVPRWNYSDRVSVAKSASASRRVTLADTTSTSQNRVKLKVNSPLKILLKKDYEQKLGYAFHWQRCGTYTKKKKKLICLSCFAWRSFQEWKAETGTFLSARGFWFFPMYRADSIYRKGKKGEGLIPSKVSLFRWRER